MMGASLLASATRLRTVLGALLLALIAAPAAAQVTVSITSTPANGTHYVLGERITTRISGLTQIGAIAAERILDCASRRPSGADGGYGGGCVWMQIAIGSVTREAWQTGVWLHQTAVNFEYVVQVDDYDTDGISIPMNSIVGKRWHQTNTQGPIINRDHAALGAQSAHKVLASSAAITSITPALFDETNLAGATIAVELTGTTFGGSVTAASFELVTTMTGATVASVSSVSSGDTTATLTLGWTGDITAPNSLAVRVLAAAHAGGRNLETGAVPVGTDTTPSLAALADKTFPRGRAIARFQLPAATGGNGTITYTATGLPGGLVFDADGSGTCGMARGICGTPTTVGNSTVTVTVSDSQSDQDTGTFGISVVAPTAATPRVLIDTAPATAALDPGPLFLSEATTASNNALGYAVRLSARPTATVMVAVASGDAGAATVNPGSLTFTTQNWATAQTVTATAVADSPDAVDESVTITHTPTGGGYSAAATLRVAVADAERTNTDYDTDEDGLIEISTLAQLNAIRWDLDGNGAVAAGDSTSYTTAFPSAATGMGCPTSGCSGYELTQDLDFDTDGDGATQTNGVSDSGDTYHDSGNGWDPIGPSIAATFTERTRRIREESFNAVFDGNGHAIHNLFISRNRDWSGLFSALRGGAVVRSLGLTNAWVGNGGGSVAPLAGTLWGRVEAAWASGSAAGNTNVGGLVGSAASGSTIVASHSTASAACAAGTGTAGGLVGSGGGDIVASYATGAVTGSCIAAYKHGLAGGAGETTASYWDTAASGVTNSTQGGGRTTAQLQAPTSASGIYVGWDDLDLDGDGTAGDAPWDFGTSSQYPALSHRGADLVVQRGDYDLDDNGLIDIYTLDQLNAMRWDLDGDGAPSSGNASPYLKAFRNHLASMGCPTSTTDADDNDCAGYELKNDLDFDTDGDGATFTGDNSNPVGDPDDAYYNGGPGFAQIGSRWGAAYFNTTLDGNGYVIANLFNRRGAHNIGGVFGGTGPLAHIHSLGLENLHVRGWNTTGGLTSHNRGRIAGVWLSGYVEGADVTGGLVGATEGASSVIVASYSTATVSSSNNRAGLVGWNDSASTIRTSYSTGAVSGGVGFSRGTGTVVASYWDTNLSGVGDDTDANPPEGITSANLRAPTGYTGIYAVWDDQDVDGDSTVGRAADADDDAWDFGDQWQWPVLKFGGLDVARQIAMQPGAVPTFPSGMVADKTYRRGFAIASFQIPAASGGDGTSYSYSATGLPAGLAFGAHCGARRVCGTPRANTAGPQTVTVYADDADTNRAASDRASLTFTITVVEPTATISSTSPATLTEATLNGAEITVTLTDSTFVSAAAASHFTLLTNVPGLVVGSLATVADGDASATLTLAYNDTDFDTPRTVAVRVAAAAHALVGTMTSLTVAVTPSLEATVSPRNLALNENASSSTNARTFTARLDSAPAANTTVSVVSSDTGAATVDTATLTFTALNWATAQTVTVTAQADDDANNETVAVALTAANVGVLATVTVTVADDDRGTVLIDADPTTAARDPGPLLLAEGATGSYSVRLSARPTATATVAVTSGDTGAVTVDMASLTFTTQNWNTPQTVTATAVAEATDTVDESVLVSHEATGGGYGGTSSSLRVGVSDAERTGTDYDTDEDGLIEISTLAQLNAVRWDLDGDGAVTSGNTANYSGASGAFASASTGMGCPAVSGAATCTGYELTQDLDFDTDGDGASHDGGTSDSDDTYHNSGSGWDPIGPASAPSDSTHFNATFDGNGHSIYNLYVNRNRNYGGLFAALRGSATVRSLGLPNAYVNISAQGSAAPLAGSSWGRVEASWASGSAAGNTNVGGLVGSTAASSVIVASYSKAGAQCGAGSAGGLVGNNAGAIVASYATGAITGSCAASLKHGLASGTGTATSSHWDRETSGTTTSDQGGGRTTAQLQGPTSAAGIYAGWDALDVDGDGDPHEAPWHFGTDSHYPALSYRGMDPVPQRGDYDYDDDGLIEVRTLAQLNAIRWDVDGDGAPASGSAAGYGKAFRNHRDDMGCPSDTTGDADLNDCAGYELENDLDFDTDGDGATWTDDGTFAADSGDAYHNGGSGWDPIGPASGLSDSTHFNATFDGNGKVIANLLVNRSRNFSGLFAALRPGAVVRALGLPNARVRNGSFYIGALTGNNGGRTAATWSSGTVTGSANVGGLAGFNISTGTIVASYSTAAVECNGSSAGYRGGGLAGRSSGNIATSYATGTVTGTCPEKHGLAVVTAGSVVASYWDTDRSGFNDDADGNPPEGVSSENLRRPTGYTGIYADWDDQDVDGDSAVGRAADADDDAWDFGDRWQWPVLKFGGLDTARQIGPQPNVPPTFGSGAVANKTYRKDFAIASFQVPAASGGEGVGYSYSASGLPAGLVFEGQCGTRRVCGTPTANTTGAATVTIYAHDGDTNRADSDRASLTFTVTVVDPTAAITATNPAALTEANLDGATLTVTLTDTAFASGVTRSSFSLATNVPGLTIASAATVNAGDTSATLTLNYPGADFTAVRTIAVRVAAAAHDLAGAITSATVSVTPTPGIALSRTMLALEEDPNAGGRTNANVGTYTIRLTADPTTATGGTCTVNITATSNNADVTLDADATPQTTTLTFTGANWNSPQTLTATAGGDGNGLDDAATIAHARTGSACAGGFFGTPTLPSLSVAVNDDDTAGIVLDADPTTMNIDEAGPLTLRELSTASDKSRSYTVRLAVEPTQDVTVAISSNDAAVTVGTASLTFTSSTWDTRQTVTLTAADDNDGVGQSATITHAASTATPSEYTNITATLTANVIDDEAPGFVFDADPSSPATDEAGPLQLDEDQMSATNSASYAVRLSAQPTQDVTATITSGDATAVAVGDTDTGVPGDQNTLTFTTTNWDTVQTVTLTAQQDDGGANERVRISHAAATTPASEYTNVSADFEATVDDDETPAIALSASTLSVPEQRSATYTVALATPPEDGSATVAITGAADGITASPTSLTFTSGNWNSPRTVTVRAANDQDSTNEMVTLAHAASGGEYDGVTADLEVTATDDDTPSLLVSPTRLRVREAGSGAYRLRLNTQPSAAVTVTVSGTTAEVTVDTDSETLGDQTTLAFSTTDWNTNRTVTVSAAADDDATDETVNLLHAATGGDYAGLALASRPGVTVSVDDDDTPAILIDANPATTNMDEPGPLALNEMSGHSANALAYTVRLATEPTAAVAVEISSGDRAVTVDNDGTPRTRTLTFSTTNWGTAQTVAATAAEDDDHADERVSIAHAATGGDYEGVEAELVATTVDDDEPAILVDAAALTASGVAEGATATYTVRLETEPAGTATVSVAAGGGLVRADMDPQQAGVQSSLRFDATTWNTARTVQVRGLEDDDAAGGTATLRHAASGADYGAAPAVETTFAVADDDSPGVVVSPTSLAVNEGGAATYSVVLEAAPTGGDATVSPTSSDAAAATVSPATLTFTAGNWDRPQRVTVRGVADDEDATDGAATVSHAVAGADYAGVPASQVAVAVRDVQAAGVRLEPPALALAEGGEASYRVRLNTQPAGDATVTATSGSSELGLRDGNAVVGTLALTFTTENWNTPQQVRASSIKDDDAADDATTVAHAVAGYAGVTSAPTLSVRVEDGDGAGIAFDPPGGVALVEGGSPATATYTAVLTAQPSGTVTVAVSSDDAGLAFDADDGATGDQSSVAFDASNWNAPRTIEVRAVADGDAASETATLTHSASGGGYGVAAGYEVRVSDADAAAAPRSVRVAAAGSRALSVGWSASANAEGYLVQWRRSGEAWSAARQLEVAAGATSARIGGLETGARYEVRVIGLNRGDPGDPSAVETASPTATRSNRAPAATGALPAEVGLAPGETRALNLAAAFSDPDGDALTYTAWSSNRSVATASVFGGELRLRAVDVGAAEVTVVAADPTELTARVRLRVVVGISLSLADASAPEGGAARLVAELSVSRAAATTFGWRVGADLDPATADADAGEHGDAAGEATIPAGETRTTIEIPIADDDDVEPAREWFEVALTAPADGCCVVQRMRARVAVREGVCDRSPAARDALRAAAACDAPTPAALAALTRLSLAGAGAGELRAGDFQNLAGLRTLDLSGNALAALPPGLFAGLAALRDLDLSGNALAALPPAPFAAVPRLRTLDLSANGFAALPPGLFAGLGNLREASLEENPGAPFALAVELARTDAEPGAAGPAAVEARFAAGAPFALRPPLAAEPADTAGLPATVSIAAGDTAGATFAAAEPPAGALRLQAAAPTLPPASCGAEWPFRACFRGFAPMPGPALLLFRQPPRSLPAPQPAPLAGDDLRLPLASLVAAGDAPGALRFEATSSDESIAAVRVVGGELLVEPEPAAEGMVEIVVVATDSAGLAATLRFEVRVEFFAPTRQAAGWRSALRTLPR